MWSLKSIFTAFRLRSECHLPFNLPKSHSSWISFLSHSAQPQDKASSVMSAGWTLYPQDDNRNWYSTNNLQCLVQAFLTALCKYFWVWKDRVCSQAIPHKHLKTDSSGQLKLAVQLSGSLLIIIICGAVQYSTLVPSRHSAIATLYSIGTVCCHRGASSPPYRDAVQYYRKLPILTTVVSGRLMRGRLN